jgi:hypothetical protein
MLKTAKQFFAVFALAASGMIVLTPGRALAPPGCAPSYERVKYEMKWVTRVSTTKYTPAISFLGVTPTGVLIR